MSNPNSPFGMDDVPDRILGNEKYIHQPTGVVIRRPGGNEGQLVRERRVPTTVSPDLCTPNSFPVIQLPPHLEPTFEAEYVHPQVTGTIDGAFEVNGIPVPIPVATDFTLFTVPRSLTLFVEKWLIQQFDSDFETLQFIPLMNGNVIRGLIPGIDVPFPNVHLPTLPQGQRNTRWEYGSGDVVGVRLINSSGASRDVCVSFLGWLNSLSCVERMRRK